MVSIRLEVTDLNGQEITGTISAGTQFLVRALVDDIRGIGQIAPDQEGVFSAYLDIAYATSLATPMPPDLEFGDLDAFAIRFGTLFNDGQKGSTTGSGIIDEVGAFQGSTAVLFSDERVLFDIKFQANTPPSGFGTLTFTPNQADNLPLNEVTLIKPDPGVSVSPALVTYIAADPITIVAGTGEGEFTNPANPNDVNDDGVVSPIDVLAVINFLNTNGATDLRQFLQGGEGEASGGAGRYYYDVNGDKIISPMDVLGLINHLNELAIQNASAEGESDEDLSESALASVLDAGLATEAATIGGLAVRTADTGYVAPTENPVGIRPMDRWTAPTTERFSPFSLVGDQPGGSSDIESLLTDGLAEDILAAWGDNAPLGDFA
jgi:hypothetical protein